MKKYKIIKEQINNICYYGLINAKTNETLIPVKFQSVENHFDKYFDVISADGRVLLNVKNEIVLDFNSNIRNHFKYMGETFKIICKETQSYNHTLCFYGENIVPSPSSKKEICIVVIKDNSVKYQMISHAELEPFF